MVREERKIVTTILVERCEDDNIVIVHDSEHDEFELKDSPYDGVYLSRKGAENLPTALQYLLGGKNGSE